MKLKLMIKGKKSGIVGSALSNFWSYVVFVFIVTFFFIFFALQNTEFRKSSIVENRGVSMDLSAVNSMRMPVDIKLEDGQVYIARDTNLADFIVQNVLLLSTGDREDNLREIKDIFEANIGGNLKYNRLMFFIGEDPQDDTLYDFCLYDDYGYSNRYEGECRPDIDPIGPDIFYRPEGVAIVPLPFGSKQIIDHGYLKLVLQ